MLIFSLSSDNLSFALFSFGGKTRTLSSHGLVPHLINRKSYPCSAISRSFLSTFSLSSVLIGDHEEILPSSWSIQAICVRAIGPVTKLEFSNRLILANNLFGRENLRTAASKYYSINCNVSLFPGK